MACRFQSIEDVLGPSQAVCCRCDVTVWDDMIALYELGMKEYGTIDIVVANAGVGAASGPFTSIKFDPDGKPLAPNLTTLNVNLIGTLYTTHLALHYLTLNRPDPKSLKAVVLIGSMASWFGIPRGEIYSASKHAVLGFMRALHPSLEAQHIRISVIHPWFADTGILTTPLKIMLAGIPLTPVSRIAGAIFYSATDPDWGTNGCAWLLTHDGPVLLIRKEEFKEGVYKMIDERSNRLTRYAFLSGCFTAVNSAEKRGASGFLYYGRLIRDLGLILRLRGLVLCLILVIGLTCVCSLLLR